MTALLNEEKPDFIYESVRLFLVCDSMRWSHLPVPGGLYAQDPRLLDEWDQLFSIVAEHKSKKLKEIQDKSRSGGSHPAMPRVR